MGKYYKLLDPQHKGLYVYENTIAYYLVKSKFLGREPEIEICDTEKFYMLPYFLRDTALFYEFEKVNNIENNYAENMFNLYNKAKRLAEEIHENQLDMCGEPLIEHLFRVANKLEYFEDKVIAMLHHSLDHLTEDDLRKDFPDFVVEAVKDLTLNMGENYDEYIKRIGQNDVATKIKLIDLQDKLDQVEDNFILEETYRQALKFLS